MTEGTPRGGGEGSAGRLAVAWTSLVGLVRILNESCRSPPPSRPPLPPVSLLYPPSPPPPSHPSPSLPAPPTVFHKISLLAHAMHLKTDASVHISCFYLYLLFVFCIEAHGRHPFFEDVPLVEFMYLVFTCMPGESYRRRLWSSWLYLCDIRLTV